MQEIGSHFVVGLAGVELSSQERELLRRLSPAGVILFRKNISKDLDWRDKLYSLRQEVFDCVGREDIIFGVDHEGGKVHRLPEPITRFPAAFNWRDSVESVALAMAQELRELGFNTGFSPVLDIHSCAENPVIGERAFSTDTNEVAEFGVRFIKTLRDAGLIACAKHFPGHGDTKKDSHFELPVVELNKEELMQRELLPFIAAIKEEIPLLMTAHVHYLRLDPAEPATLSSIILQQLLRDELGYQGVVISDDLQMKALSYLSPEEIGVKCLQAGVDLLLVGNVEEEPPLVRSLGMAEAIDTALCRGELVAEQFKLSTTRINQLRTLARPFKT